jgi:hypothetical protein
MYTNGSMEVLNAGIKGTYGKYLFFHKNSDDLTMPLNINVTSPIERIILLSNRSIHPSLSSYYYYYYYYGPG